jgi:IS5 family transposase
MRIRAQKQLYFKPQSKEIKADRLLEEISKIIDELPNYNQILDSILKDLNPSQAQKKSGAQGMTAEQVLRAYIVRKLKGYSYRELEHSSNDSISVKEFLRINCFKRGFKYKTFQENIKKLSEVSIDLVNEAIKKFALASKIEDGQKTRTDGFSTGSNIHHPTDWSLMNDSIRILSRIMTYSKEDLNVPLNFRNHYRASKTKLFEINNTKNQKKKRKLNIEMIRLSKATIKHAKVALPIMEEFKDKITDISAYAYLSALIEDLNHFMPLVEKVIDQAYRRIIKEEQVRSAEKIVSIFEEHTDIIAKGNREIVFGHKHTITTGKSGLILDIETHKGNPADSTLVRDVIKRHREFYGEAPRSAVFDGCYASKANRELAKAEKIENICFSKETDSESACTKVIRRMLRNFRAGIEASVSMLKRMFGLTRILDKGHRSFKCSAKASVMTYNLFILARIRLTS